MPSTFHISSIGVLRLSPVILSTATFTYANCENLFLSTFLSRPPSAPAEHRQHANALLPSYFARFFAPAVIWVVGSYTTTAIVAGLNLVYGKEQLVERGGWWLYATGLVGTLTHFAFVPLVAGPVKDLQDMAKEQEKGEGRYDLDGEGKAVKAMQRWLDVHRWRMVCVDGLTWCVYIAAVAVNFGVVELRG